MLDANELEKDIAAREKRGEISVRQRLSQFIKTTKHESGATFVFDLPGNEAAARSYVQAMRSELSRLRSEAQSLGRRQRRFKMNVISYTFKPEEYLTVVMLRYVSQENRQMVEELFEDITLGDTE